MYSLTPKLSDYTSGIDRKRLIECVILRSSLIESRQISMNVSMPMEDANKFVQTLKVALNVPATKGSL